MNTWSCDYDVRIGCQLSKLSLHGVPSHQHCSAQVGVAAQLLHHFVSLQCQLPGGSQQDSSGATPQ